MASLQRTLARPARLAGAGVHAGASAEVAIRPAPPNHGLRFVRPGGAASAPAHADFVTDTVQCTAIRLSGGDQIATIEHLLAACYACGLDNALIEVEGPELPILDGSALGWAQAIEEAGLLVQDAPRRSMMLLKPVHVEDGAKRAALLPSERFTLSATIRYADPVIGVQSLTIAGDRESVRAGLIPARTFGFLADLDAYRAMGKARGASLENTIAVTPGGIANPEGLRFADEFVRHKLLDALGDLMLAGAPLLARYEADQPGHGLNARLVRALLNEPDAYSIVTV